MAGSGTDSQYENGTSGPSTKKKLRTENEHKKCVTTYSRQNFKPSETQSTANESRRGSSLQIIGDIVIEYDNNEMEVDDENPTIDHVQKPREIIGVRFDKAPKTSAERGREFRARKALLKQQIKQQQESDAIVEIATEDIRSAGPSEDNQVPGPSEIRTIEKRAKSAEATRRWREKKKGDSESSKKQAKTAAQRMREYRKRKKMSQDVPNFGASSSKSTVQSEAMEPKAMSLHFTDAEAVHEVLIKPDPDALEQEDDTNCGSEYTDINSSSMFGGKTDVNDIVPILREMSSHLQKMANKQEDSFESFGKYVATTLRNMPERNSMELQLQIVNLLIADQNKIKLPTNAGEKS